MNLISILICGFQLSQPILISTEIGVSFKKGEKMIDIAALGKEMADYYQEDSLKWILMLKRLEQHGYGIYKVPSFSTEPIENVQLNSTPTIKEPECIKKITQDSQTYNKVLLVPADTTKIQICAVCGEQIKPNSKGFIIQYQNKNYCFGCALQRK